ncbi:MAG TPA: hypothetical protein VEI02_17200, partial [Planctomycetota bacterium]|nr:hypothetical protein [Planctomycetota bacterium]
MAARARTLVSALALAALIAFGRSCSVATAGFVYDDEDAILEHPHLRDVRHVGRLFLTEYWGGDRANQMYRPLQQVSYLIDGVLFDFEREATHASHLAWHLAAVLAGFALLKRVGVGAGPAFAAAAAFGVHPALTDASVWISGRCDVLALLFSALALLRYRAVAAADVPRTRDAVLAAAWLLAAALSKEVGLAAPGAALVLFGRRAARGGRWTCAALAVYGALRLGAVEGFLPGLPDDVGVVLQDRDLFERVAIGCRAQLLLVGRLFAPWLSVADHRAHPLALPAAPVGVSGVVSIVVFVATFVAAARARGPSAGAIALRLTGAAAAFFVPVLQIWPIGAVMPERFLYVPALFLLGAVARLGAAAVPNAPRWSWSTRVLAPGLFAGVVVLCLTLGLRDKVGDRRVYDDDGAFFSDVVAAYPHDERAWNNLGVYWMKDATPPRFDDADRCLEEAVRLRPGYRRGALNLARSALERHRTTRDASRLHVAEAALEARLGADDGDAWMLLGHVESRRIALAADDVERLVCAERAESAFLRAAEALAREARPRPAEIEAARRHAAAARATAARYAAAVEE